MPTFNTQLIPYSDRLIDTKKYGLDFNDIDKKMFSIAYSAYRKKTLNIRGVGTSSSTNIYPRTNVAIVALFNHNKEFVDIADKKSSDGKVKPAIFRIDDPNNHSERLALIEVIYRGIKKIQYSEKSKDFRIKSKKKSLSTLSDEELKELIENELTYDNLQCLEVKNITLEKNPILYLLRKLKGFICVYSERDFCLDWKDYDDSGKGKRVVGSQSRDGCQTYFTKLSELLEQAITCKGWYSTKSHGYNAELLMSYISSQKVQYLRDNAIFLTDEERKFLKDNLSKLEKIFQHDCFNTLGKYFKKFTEISSQMDEDAFFIEDLPLILKKEDDTDTNDLIAWLEKHYTTLEKQKKLDSSSDHLTLYPYSQMTNLCNKDYCIADNNVKRLYATLLTTITKRQIQSTLPPNPTSKDEYPSLQDAKKLSPSKTKLVATAKVMQNEISTKSFTSSDPGLTSSASSSLPPLLPATIAAAAPPPVQNKQQDKIEDTGTSAVCAETPNPLLPHNWFPSLQEAAKLSQSKKGDDKKKSVATAAKVMQEKQPLTRQLCKDEISTKSFTSSKSFASSDLGLTSSASSSLPPAAQIPQQQHAPLSKSGKLDHPEALKAHETTTGPPSSSAQKSTVAQPPLLRSSFGTSLKDKNPSTTGELRNMFGNTSQPETTAKDLLVGYGNIDSLPQQLANGHQALQPRMGYVARQPQPQKLVYPGNLGKLPPPRY